MLFHHLLHSPSHPLTPSLLAQASRSTAQVQVVVWVIVLIVVVLFAFAVLYFVHKKLFGDRQDSVDTEGLMATMRRMKDRGEMSQEEFDQARKALSRKSVADVEARLAARKSQQSDTAKRDAARAAAQKIIDAGSRASDPPKSE